VQRWRVSRQGHRGPPTAPCGGRHVCTPPPDSRRSSRGCAVTARVLVPTVLARAGSSL